jgi:hypothetical protein
MNLDSGNDVSRIEKVDSDSTESGLHSICNTAHGHAACVAAQQDIVGLSIQAAED